MGHNQSTNTLRHATHELGIMPQYSEPTSPNLRRTTGPSTPPLRSTHSTTTRSPSSFKFSPQVRTLKDMMIDKIHKSAHKRSTRSTSSPATNKIASLEKFFISLHQRQQHSGVKEMPAHMLEHRIAFVSLPNLYHMFRSIPSRTLFSSLFILNLKHEWLYNPSNRDQDNLLHVLGFARDQEFMTLLHWKDSQGLLFCMHASNDDDMVYSPCSDELDTPRSADDDMSSLELPSDLGIESDDEEDTLPPQRLRMVNRDAHYEARKETLVMQLESDSEHSKHVQVHASWLKLSAWLSALYDPCRGTNYDALETRCEFWNTCSSRFGVSGGHVVSELERCDMNYRCAMEILLQSNPSLIPCQNYRELQSESLSGRMRDVLEVAVRPKKVELLQIHTVSSSMEYLDEMSAAHTSDCDVDMDMDMASLADCWMNRDYERRSAAATAVATFAQS